VQVRDDRRTFLLRLIEQAHRIAGLGDSDGDPGRLQGTARLVRNLRGFTVLPYT
jgi:hypothetical protein